MMVKGCVCSPSGWSAAGSSLMAFVNPLDALPLVRCDAADQDFKRNPQRSGRRGLSTVAQPLIRGLIPHDDDASEGWLVLAADVGLIVARPK
jgi:hypothetical protein